MIKKSKGITFHKMNQSSFINYTSSNKNTFTDDQFFDNNNNNNKFKTPQKFKNLIISPNNLKFFNYNRRTEDKGAFLTKSNFKKNIKNNKSSFLINTTINGASATRNNIEDTINDINDTVSLTENSFKNENDLINMHTDSKYYLLILIIFLYFKI
jgi:hypothetical protein